MAQNPRLRRRIIGLLKARLPDLQLGSVPDPRQARGLRWPLEPLLRVVLAGIIAGSKSLSDVERLTCNMTLAARKLLGIGRRVPDTTLRSLLCSLLPQHIRSLLHHQTLAAYRRKSLKPTELPIGVLALDGKATSLPSCDDHYAQRQTAQAGALVGVLRTMTCCLISAAALPCIDAIPIPADTNEMAFFSQCLAEIMQVYGHLDLFRMVAADAGSCSLANASVARSYGLHYLFALKNTQPTLLQEARRLLDCLGPEQADAMSDDLTGGHRREVRRLWLTDQMAGFGWEHLRTVLRVQSETFEHGRLAEQHTRYFVCSLGTDRLHPEQWLKLVRQYWMVENGPHWTLDVALHEDPHPWIEADPQGALVVALLRRVAYNMLSMFRAVTLRSELNRSTPWKDLIADFLLALLQAVSSDLLRSRDDRPRMLAAS